ncbi:hypothetical protein KUG85_04415 [Nitratireductor sp. L1-7-SE]|uniref:Uncharacterized protein n=1 Tax=Nitratireductor rhodophyticola TaxID=2854036 RepID=A0ABS7R3P9_9HYPH|nr:hypothetical protein [Nitratireductor rhodophyticola]MBY8914995.1 hypothetical protein [Nitratireductor rhodophyticola]MBY8919935.1 hypothetical protein [Nitratireductor rhodophyticola]MEC9246608.1 hypothetical protein [Pseudomonadota bacterium]
MGLETVVDPSKQYLLPENQRSKKNSKKFCNSIVKTPEVAKNFIVT